MTYNTCGTVITSTPSKNNFKAHTSAFCSCAQPTAYSYTLHRLWYKNTLSFCGGRQQLKGLKTEPRFKISSFRPSVRSSCFHVFCLHVTIFEFSWWNFVHQDFWSKRKSYWKWFGLDHFFNNPPYCKALFWSAVNYLMVSGMDGCGNYGDIYIDMVCLILFNQDVNLPPPVR